MDVAEAGEKSTGVTLRIGTGQRMAVSKTPKEPSEQKNIEGTLLALRINGSADFTYWLLSWKKERAAVKSQMRF